MDKPIFTLHMFPARSGDTLLMKFGRRGKERKILIDAGYSSSIKELFDELQGDIDLFVVTHSDEDHISGAITLLEQAKSKSIEIKNIWFNGYNQVFGESDILGYPDAERLSALIKYFGIPLNRDPSLVNQYIEDGGRVVSSEMGIRRICFEGLTLDILGPSESRLNSLREEWTAKRGAKLGSVYMETLDQLKRGDDILGAKSKPGSDRTVPNGSSIALLAQYEGVSVLLAGDAFAEDLRNALAKRTTFGDIKIFKLSHHGSVANITSELIDEVGASHYLISTNGKHGHPDTKTIRLIAEARKEKLSVIHFNYERVRKRIKDKCKHLSVDFGQKPTIKGNQFDLFSLK